MDQVLWALNFAKNGKTVFLRWVFGKLPTNHSYVSFACRLLNLTCKSLWIN